MSNSENSESDTLEIYKAIYKAVRLVPFLVAATLMAIFLIILFFPFLYHNLIDPYTLVPNSEASKLMENKPGAKITLIDIVCGELKIVINRPDELDCINQAFEMRSFGYTGNARDAAAVVHFADGSKHKLYLSITDDPRCIGIGYSDGPAAERTFRHVQLPLPIPRSLADAIDRLSKSRCHE